jgi:hypothetical protein
MGYTQRHASRALPATPREDTPEKPVHDIRLGKIQGHHLAACHR